MTEVTTDTTDRKNGVLGGDKPKFNTLTSAIATGRLKYGCGDHRQ